MKVINSKKENCKLIVQIVFLVKHTGVIYNNITGLNSELLVFQGDNTGAFSNI
jgi:hypothetical protein